MRFLITSFAAGLFALMPLSFAHAQSPSNSCTPGATNECPSNTTCDITSSGFQCVSTSATPSSAIQQSGGGNTGGIQQPGGGNSGTRLLNPLQGGTDVESFLINILSFIVRIGAIVVVLMLVYVGYLFVVARGEPGKISEARTALLWTVVGALILLGSQAIAYGIKATVSALSAGQ